MGSRNGLKRKGFFGKQEHKNISRPQPLKFFQNIIKSKKATKKRVKTTSA